MIEKLSLAQYLLMSQRLPPIHSTPKQQKTQNSFNLGVGANSGLGDISFQQKSKSSYSPYSPHTFMLNSEVQNNYSAYRLNNNSDYLYIQDITGLYSENSGKSITKESESDAHNQPINNAGGYNNYTNPQYNMHPYQQGYPGHYGNPMMAFQPPQQMDFYAMPQNPLMARPNVQIPNLSRNFSTNHVGYQPADIHAMTDRGPNTTRLMPLDQSQITRNTRYNPDGSQFRDIRTQNIQRNNMSVHNQTIYYSSPTTMVNVEDDMQILKTVLVSPKEGLTNQTTILGNQTAIHTTNNTMILDQTRFDSEGPEKLNRTKSSLKKSKLTKKDSQATPKSVHYSNSGAAGSAGISSGEKPTLKSLLWTIVYPRLWMKDVDSKVEIRRDGVFNEVNQCISILGDVIQSQCGDALNAIYNEKKSMVLVSGEEKSVLSGAKELSAKEITQRSALVIPKVEALFQSLQKLVSEYVLPTPVMKFLGTLSGYKGAPPQLFFTDFEIARMQFTNIGTIADMEPLRSKMIIGVLILVRTLGYTLLMKPWDTVKGLKKKSELVKNLKTVGSVVYHIVMDYFRVTVPPIPNNQAHLSVEKRLKSRKGGPIVAFEEELNNEGDMKTFVKEEVIIGIYSKRKLKDFFNANQAAVESLQGKIEEWLEAMYELIIKVYTQERKKEAS